MGKSQRRDKRHKNDLIVKLFLRDENSDSDIAGPAQCFISDLSSYGAGLILTQVHFEGRHLFYTPEDNPEICLYLESESKSNGKITLPVRPIWFNLDESEDSRYFMMGVEFLADPDDERVLGLKKVAVCHLSEGQGWFSKVVGRLLG